MTHALVGTRTLRFFARERRRVSLGEAFPSDTPGRVPARVPGEMSSGASTRATLRRLLRVASRYDVERPHLKALLPSPSARGDGSAKTTLRDLVRRTALDPAGHGLPVADPPRARALVRGNLDALETVMRRADAQTALQRRDARAISAGGSASGGSDAALSVARAGDHLGRPRLEMADAVRRAVDTTLTRVSAERLASITRDANAEPWLRRAGARETRRRRDVRGGWSAPATAAAAANDAPGAFFGVSAFRKGSARPNAEWYADRLDAVLEEARTETPRTDPNTVYGSIARLFREARATGCPPPVTDVARAATFLAETTSSPRVIARGDEEEISRRDDGSLADASERGVDAALRLAWTAFEMEGTYLRDGGRTDETVAFDGFDDESITRTEASKENKNGAVGAAADAVVSAAARCAAATPAGPAKRNRTVRALNLLHAHMDVCVDAPGRDAAAAAVAVAARFVADESDTSEKKKKSRRIYARRRDRTKTPKPRARFLTTRSRARWPAWSPWASASRRARAARCSPPPRRAAASTKPSPFWSGGNGPAARPTPTRCSVCSSGRSRRGTTRRRSGWRRSSRRRGRAPTSPA